MICSYCKTDNVADQSVCTFCAAPLSATRPKIQRFIDISDVLSDFTKKTSYHTFDLLLMLKIARQERTSAYTTLKTLLKAQNEMNVPIELKKASEDDYKTFTAHVNQIQEILIDRLGYYPKRIDDRLLDAYHKKLV